jgi:hypothetical protein
MEKTLDRHVQRTGRPLTSVGLQEQTNNSTEVSWASF